MWHGRCSSTVDGHRRAAKSEKRKAGRRKARGQAGEGGAAAGLATLILQLQGMFIKDILADAADLRRQGSRLP